MCPKLETGSCRLKLSLVGTLVCDLIWKLEAGNWNALLSRDSRLSSKLETDRPGLAGSLVCALNWKLEAVPWLDGVYKLCSKLEIGRIRLLSSSVGTLNCVIIWKLEARN